LENQRQEQQENFKKIQQNMQDKQDQLQKDLEKLGEKKCRFARKIEGIKTTIAKCKQKHRRIDFNKRNE